MFKILKYLLTIIIIVCSSIIVCQAKSIIPDISTLSNVDINLPSKYDLRNVNGVNYTTPLKDQENLGLCWAFAGTTAFESYLKKSGYVDNDFNEWYSPYQVDALLSEDAKRPKINYVSNLLGNHKLGAENETESAFRAFTTAYSPVLQSKFTRDFYFNRYESVSNNLFSSSDIYNERNSEYYVSDFDILNNVNNISKNNVIKYYISNYGGVIIGTVAPAIYCNNYYEDCYYEALQKDSAAYGHVMTIIGWDDSKNSWILQNSWGKSFLPYVYLSYDSYIQSVAGIKNIDKIDFDNRYYGTNANNLSNSDFYSIHDFGKISDNDEMITSILVEIASAGNYSLYISTNGNDENYELVSTFTSSFEGRKTIDLENQKITLKSDKFKVKLEYNGNDNYYLSTNDIYVYTKDIKQTTDKKIYINDMGDITTVFQNVYVNFKALNISNSSDINFKFYDENNNDISSNFNIVDKYLNRNYGQFIYSINSNFKLSKEYKEYKISAIVDGKIMSSKKIGVQNLEDIFDGGNGSNEEPFIITTADQIEKLAAIPEYFKYSYKLENNINLKNVSHIPIGNETSPFTGTFDGNNYIISDLNNFNTSKKTLYYGLFGYIKNAEIKNIKFSNSGYTANKLSATVGIAVGYSEKSKLENIIIDKGNIFINKDTNKGYGSVVGVSNESNLKNIYSSSNIEINITNPINPSGSIGGIVGRSIYTKSYDSINTAQFEGNVNINGLTDEFGYFGEIVGYSTGIKASNIMINGKIDYNCELSNKELCDERNSKIGYFNGRGNFMLNNSVIFYNNSNNFLINNPFSASESNYVIVTNDIENNKYFKYINKNDAKYLIKDTYDLDFENIWTIDLNGPKLKILLNFVDKTDNIGESNEYIIDHKNNIISNIKTIDGRLSKKEFINGFTTFTGKIYTKDGKLIDSDDELIKTGMIIKNNNKEYRIVVLGDIYEDGKVNSADVISLRRALVDIINLDEVQSVAADLNQDGIINTTDVMYLRKGIVGGYNVCIWRDCK